MDMSLSKLQELVIDREDWWVVRGVGKEASGEAKTGSSSGRVLTEYLGFLQGWN